MEEEKITDKSKEFIKKYTENKNFKKYDKNFKNIINSVPLGTVISYVSKDKEDKITFKVGGFLINRKDDYFMLRNNYNNKFISFPVQYRNILLMFVRNDEQIQKTKEDLKKIASKELTKHVDKDFIIKIRNVKYKDFNSLKALKTHLTSKKFKMYSKNFKDSNIKFYNKTEELKNIL